MRPPPSGDQASTATSRSIARSSRPSVIGANSSAENSGCTLASGIVSKALIACVCGTV